MPKVKAGQLTVNYESQGSGEPLILIPYLAADHACYAFRVAEYAKRFTCISIDLPGTGESNSLKNGYSTEDLADCVEVFMQADIAAPTLMTFGRYDMVTSLRFAERLKNGIRNSELLVLEGARTHLSTNGSRSSTRRPWNS